MPLAVLGSTLSLFAQNCNTAPPAQTLATYRPWQATNYFGNVAGNTMNLMVDIDVQSPITINSMNVTTYDQGVGSPVVPNQVGNVARVNIYLIPTTRSGNETNMAAWGLTTLGQPDISADLTIVAWNGDSPINNFQDALGNPQQFNIAPGQYGMCIEYVPTTWTGTPLAAQNPGSLHCIGVATNPGTTWGDQFLSMTNDGMCQNGWQTVDPLTGAIGPNVGTINGAQGSINLEINYTPAASAAISIPFGAGCYDKPRMVYEQIPAGTAPDLVDTTWSFFYQAGSGNYLIIPGGPGYDAVNPVNNGTNVVAGAYTSSSSASWDDACVVVALDPLVFTSGFDFPGGNCTDITINSNGKIYLGNTVDGSFDTCGANYGSTAPFQGNTANTTLPQLSPWNTDLDPTDPSIFTATTGIYVEQPSPNGGIRVTWHNVPNWPAVAGAFCDIQMELTPGGNVTWAFGGPTSTGTNGLVCVGGGNDAIVGFSAGNGLPLSTPVDFSALAGYTTGDGAYSPTLSLAARPVVGTNVDVTVSNLSPGTGQPFGGFLSVSLGGVASPGLPLQGFGLPGCFGHINIAQVAFTVLLTNPSNTDMTWTWVNIPNAVGVQTFMQAATFTTTPHNAIGMLVTNGLCAKIGT
ncbi:MAG: hypothetical protein KDC98_21405 [Planctomycetes bacterium]|nr:hypothetical protein [Planctomycetota bacterium]